MATPSLLPGEMFLTALQLRGMRLDDAKCFLEYLRNRISHRMDYLDELQKKYTQEGSDLAHDARFSLVTCILQKELFTAKGIII